MLKSLESHFTKEKKRNPIHVNELLDFLQKRYISGELSIVEYKKFFSELDKRNAEKPTSYIIGTHSYNNIYIPG
ncbi:YppF family protein [Niallia sp. Krafla_26]|uniref:YppF family protein n=1 Tax=Niallia sp. Krafla_26 TaxID=3064703 RepID=UPI003D16995D